MVSFFSKLYYELMHVLKTQNSVHCFVPIINNGFLPHWRFYFYKILQLYVYYVQQSASLFYAYYFECKKLNYGPLCSLNSEQISEKKCNFGKSFYLLASCKYTVIEEVMFSPQPPRFLLFFLLPIFSTYMYILNFLDNFFLPL